MKAKKSEESKEQKTIGVEAISRAKRRVWSQTKGRVVKQKRNDFVFEGEKQTEQQQHTVTMGEVTVDRLGGIVILRRM